MVLEEMLRKRGRHAVTALQLKVGFRATFWSAIGISLFDAAAGLMLSAVVDAAPGGLTALVSVGVLALTAFWKRLIPILR